ncbi:MULTISPECIES: hypothetical protein [unclassified Bradyrhizobium]
MADDITDGMAGSAAPAANPETDLRKSRRFMKSLQLKSFWLELDSQGSCQSLTGAYDQIKVLKLNKNSEANDLVAVWAAAFIAYKE